MNQQASHNQGGATVWPFLGLVAIGLALCAAGVCYLFLPPGRYPYVVIGLPSVPFVYLALWCFKRDGIVRARRMARSGGSTSTTGTKVEAKGDDGRPDEKDERRVTVPLSDPRWPSRCPCCGQPADTRFPLRRSRVTAVETVLRLGVPYCSPCARHAHRVQAGTVLGMLLPTARVFGIAFFAALVWLMSSPKVSVEVQTYVTLGMPALTAMLFAGYRINRRVLTSVDTSHASAAPVVRVHAWTDRAVY